MAHLLIIELPGGNDFDIIQAAIDRGDEFTFLTANLDLYRRQPKLFAKLTLARELIEVPGFAEDAVDRIVLAAHARHPFDAVLCLIDIRIIDAARLAAQLGLRFLNPDSAKLLRDKFSVRRRLADCGLAQPPFALAESSTTLKQAVDRLGLPVLIKPSDGYGSQNIVALLHPEDLDPLLSPLDDMLPCKAEYGFGVRANDRLLVERYMDGILIGCDTLSANGRHMLLGVNEKAMFEAPSFAIRGSSFTPYGPAFDHIARYVFQLLNAVGFDWGATHIELLLTDNGPQLVEINPRLVGAKIPRQVGYALGRSLHEDVIALHLGRELPEVVPHAPQICTTRWFVADDTGFLEQVVFPSWFDERIRCVELLKQPGDAVRPPFENADRIGYVMTCADTRQEAERLADYFVASSKVAVTLTRPLQRNPEEYVC